MPGRCRPASSSCPRPSRDRRRPVGPARPGRPAHPRHARRGARRLRGLARRWPSARRVLMDLWPAVRRSVYPLLVGSQTVPILVVAPLLVLVARLRARSQGRRRSSSLTFFPIVVGLLDGFAGVPAEATDLLRSYGASTRPGAPAAALADRAAVVLHRPPDRGHVRDARRGLRRVRRVVRRPRDLDPDRARRRSGSTSCSAPWPSSWSSRSRLFVAVGLLERLVIPWAGAARRSRDEGTTGLA